MEVTDRNVCQTLRDTYGLRSLPPDVVQVYLEKHQYDGFSQNVQARHKAIWWSLFIVLNLAAIVQSYIFGTSISGWFNIMTLIVSFANMYLVANLLRIIFGVHSFHKEMEAAQDTSKVIAKYSNEEKGYDLLRLSFEYQWVCYEDLSNFTIVTLRCRIIFCIILLLMGYVEHTVILVFLFVITGFGQWYAQTKIHSYLSALAHFYNDPTK